MIFSSLTGKIIPAMNMWGDGEFESLIPPLYLRLDIFTYFAAYLKRVTAPMESPQPKCLKSLCLFTSTFSTS